MQSFLKLFKVEQSLKQSLQFAAATNELVAN